MPTNFANIRLARADDARHCLEVSAPAVRAAPSPSEPAPPSVAGMRERIEQTLAMFPWLVEERDGRVMGYAYASWHRERKAYQWSADVSCYVHPDARRQGVGSRLYAVLLRTLHRQGFHAAFAGITLPNAASEALHEAASFKRIGVYRGGGYKGGGWRDVGWYQCILGDAVPEPPAPRALHALGLELGLGVLDEA